MTPAVASAMILQARAEREESCAVARLDDDQSRQRRRKRSPDALRGDDGALRDIEAAGVAHEIGDYHGKDSAKDSSADTVEKLDAHQPCGIIGQGIERTANGKDEQRRKKKTLVPPTVRFGPDQHGHRHHHDLRGNDAGRHQAGAEMPVPQRELLSDQRQHRRIRQVKQCHADREDQQRPAGREDTQSGRLVSFPPGPLLSVMQAAREIMIDGGFRNGKDTDEARE